MMGRLPGLLLYVGVVAEAKLVVHNQDELLLSRLVVDGLRVMVLNLSTGHLSLLKVESFTSS